MTVVDVEADEAAALYKYKLLLSRPDQHVAWRGDKPSDALIRLPFRRVPLVARVRPSWR